jgi:hypothetical protein
MFLSHESHMYLKSTLLHCPNMHSYIGRHMQATSKIFLGSNPEPPLYGWPRLTRLRRSATNAGKEADEEGAEGRGKGRR